MKEKNISSAPDTTENGFCLLNTPEQILEILSEFRNCLPVLASGEEYRLATAEKLSQYAFVVLLKIDGRNAGFATIYANNHETKTGYVSFIAVAERFRRMHLGTQIMNRLFRIAKENYMESVKLEVAKANITAQKFYQSSGFQYHSDAGKDTVYMIKYLNDAQK